jgi:ketosteroid isomerase-like protein
MSADINIKTIQSVYDAFGTGDVGAILDALTDDVDWASDTTSTAAPWYGVRKGKDQVRGFFEAFGSEMEVEQFDVVSIAGNDTDVHTVVKMKATRRSTGASIAMNLHHYFVLDDGRISYYRGSEDSALTEAIFPG